MSLSQTEIVQRAERLATELQGGPVRVEKNVLLSVVADFLSDPRGDVERLRRTLKLLKEGSGGHLKRSASYAQQIETVTEGLRETLADQSLSAADLKSLFGWTARLLLVRGEGEAPRAAAQEPQKRPSRPAAKSTLGDIGGTLARLKKDLEKKEKG